MIEVSFEKMEKLKLSHSKVKHLSHCRDYKIQEYMISNKVTSKISKLIFNMRSNCVKGFRDNTLTSLVTIITAVIICIAKKSNKRFHFIIRCSPPKRRVRLPGPAWNLRPKLSISIKGPTSLLQPRTHEHIFLFLKPSSCHSYGTIF